MGRIPCVPVSRGGVRSPRCPLPGDGCPLSWPMPQPLPAAEAARGPGVRRGLRAAGRGLAGLRRCGCLAPLAMGPTQHGEGLGPRELGMCRLQAQDTVGVPPSPPHTHTTSLQAAGRRTKHTRGGVFLRVLFLGQTRATCLLAKFVVLFPPSPQPGEQIVLILVKCRLSLHIKYEASCLKRGKKIRDY